MSLSAEECWKSLITRFGPPLEPGSLDENTVELAITERRALTMNAISDGFGSGDVYFYRPQMGSHKWVTFVFSRPCEITDEEIAALDYTNPWERRTDIDRFTYRILSPGCWKSLITRYGAPLGPEHLDEDTLKLAIAEKRALKVVEVRYYVGGEYKSGYMYFRRAEVGDTIKGLYICDRPYFCIVFPQPCEISDQEVRIIEQFPFDWWEEVCEFTNAIVREEYDSP